MSDSRLSHSVRTATLPDVADIDVLLAKSYPALLKTDYAPSVMVTALPLISRAQPALVTCGTYFVVEDGAEVCAAGGWTQGAPKGGLIRAGRGHIRHVVTHHRRTRRGYGRALMQHIFRSAYTQGMTELEALSTLTAQPFYSALGFVALEEVDVPLGPAGLPFRTIRMLRPL